MITKKINKNFQKRNLFISLLIGSLILAIVIFRVLFPIFVINNNMKNDFIFLNINNKKYLKLKIKEGHAFHKIFIKIIFDDKNDSGFKNNEILGKIYQDELGLYTKGKDINTRAELYKYLKIPNVSGIMNGELIQKGNAVYFISGNQYRAFSNAESFDILGFDWNKIKKGEEDFLMNLTKGKNITKNETYLKQSFVVVGNKTYLIDGHTKYLIANKKLIKQLKNQFSFIVIKERKIKSLGKMNCQKEKLAIFNCKFEDKTYKTLPQAKVIIELINNQAPTKWSSRIYTFDKLKSAVPKRSLSNIKRNLILKYDQRFGIGERVNK